MQQLYLAATGMNRGKTTVALGLLAALIESGRSTGFIKPVGQRYAVVDGVPADEDAILMRSVFDLPDALGDLSPVHIPRGFTRAFIEGKVGDDLSARIRAACARVADSREVLLVEGTGHAGVGAVIGLSNAQVAAMLGTPALIVSEGGVGRPIDEIVLNRALFRQHGVPVAGAIVNKVDLDGHPGLGKLVRSGLAHHGIELLGVLPYRPILSNATLAMLLQQMPGKLLHAGPDPSRPIEHVAIAAMQARHVLERVGPGSLVIVAGDREDVIEAIVHAQVVGWPGANGANHRSRGSIAGSLAGLVLTGAHPPSAAVLERIRRADLFALQVEDGTYGAASAVHDLLVKTHPDDSEKIALIKRLVAEHLDLERILQRVERSTAPSAS